MSSLYLSLLTAIQTKLQGITTGEKVYTRERYIVSESDVKNILSCTDTTYGMPKLACWFIEWQGWPETDEEYSAIEDEFGDLYRFKIKHIRGFQDIIAPDPNGFGSDEWFNQECELGANAVRAVQNYGVPQVVNYGINCLFTTIEKRMIVNTLFHYAEMQLDIDVQQHIPQIG